MYRLLHLRINLHHPLIQIRMIPHQNLGIPRARHEDRVHPAANRRHEDLAHLQPDQEGKRHDDGRELAAFVVLGFGEFEVEEGEEGAEIGDKGAAHGKDRADQAVVDESVDAAVLHHARNSVFQPSVSSMVIRRTQRGGIGRAYVHVSLAAGIYAFPYKAMCEKA